MTEYELALQEYMQRLKGGFGNAMKTVGQGASMPFSGSMIGKGIEGITGLLSGEEVGTRGLNSDAESGFLKSLLGGNLEVNDANTQKVFDSLEHLSGAGVTRNNASGTDPMMMVADPMAGVGARGLNTQAEQTFLQDTMGSGSFIPDSRMNVSNLGIGTRGLDTPAERDYLTGTMNNFINSMTAEEQNVYMQLDDSQRPAFLKALQDNKISQYEAENFDRLRM